MLKKPGNMLLCLGFIGLGSALFLTGCGQTYTWNSLLSEFTDRPAVATRPRRNVSESRRASFAPQRTAVEHMAKKEHAKKRRGAIHYAGASTTVSTRATVPNVDTGELASASASSEKSSELTLGGDDASKRLASKTLTKVKADLAGVNRTNLSAGEVTVYDQATGFASAADDALRQRNYPEAKLLADKAFRLSTRLAADVSR